MTVFIDEVYIRSNIECIVEKLDGDGPFDFYFRELSYHPIECIRNNPNRFDCRPIPVDFAPTIGKEFWLVVVRYSGGDSFGVEQGCADLICGLCNKSDVLELKQIIIKCAEKDDITAYENWMRQRKATKEQIVLFAEWFGHFCSFEDVETHKMFVGI